MTDRPAEYHGLSMLWDMEQGSDEWLEAHTGLLTASSAGKLLTPTGKVSASRNALIGQIVAEAMGLQERETFAGTAWMVRGIELEPSARKWYAFDHDLDILEVGFVRHGSGWVGCSPDGLIWEDDYLIPLEIKCPKASTHIAYVLDGVLPSAYVPQVHFQMALLQAPWARFISYHPQVGTMEVNVEWNDYTDGMEQAITDFILDSIKLSKQLKDKTQ